MMKEASKTNNKEGINYFEMVQKNLAISIFNGNLLYLSHFHIEIKAR